MARANRPSLTISITTEAGSGGDRRVGHTTPSIYRGSRVIAWALYDVANSSFTTLIVTFIYSTYFVGSMGGLGQDLTWLWTTGISFTAITVSLLSPLVGAVADRGGYRKRFLLSFSATCVIATAALAFIEPGRAGTAIVIFVVANVAFELGAALYDSFLPGLVPQESIGRVSGFGWGLGYVGGMAAMMLALYGFVRTESPLYPMLAGVLGLAREGGADVRATALLVAVWFSVFTLPFIVLVPEPAVRSPSQEGNAVMAAFQQLGLSFKQIRKYRQIVRLILARLIYNDGLVVIFALGAVFASKVHGFITSETIVFAIVLNIAAGIGAIGFGFLDDRIGGRKTILFSLVGLVAAGTLAIAGQSRATFWVAAICVGLLVGPNQSASRSLLGRFVPADNEAEFYGFFAFSGKASAFLGPSIYGALVAHTGSHRVGMGVTVALFIIGALLLLRVDEQEGIAASGRQHGTASPSRLPVATPLFTISSPPVHDTTAPGRYRDRVTSRSQGAPPLPAELLHLRPTDAAGLRVVALALAGTAVGVAFTLMDGWGFWLAGQALLGLVFVQWFVILHECGHDTLFRTRRYHLLAGRLAAFFSLIPYEAWTRVHGRHHKWTGWQDLDPTTESLVPRPLGRAERALVNTCWRLWIPLFSVLYRANNYWHLPRILRLFPKPRDRQAITWDLAVLLAIYGGILAIAGPAAVMRVTGVALLVSLGIEDLLLLSQHTHVPQHVSRGETVRPFPALEQEPFTRSLRLPWWLSAFVLHFDAHELHHMYPFVPGYHLHRIAYVPHHEIGWWQWIRGAKRMRGDVLLFQNRLESGYDL